MRDPTALLLAVVPLAFGAAVYAPIVHNYFFADDFLNLYRIANLSPLEYVLTPHAGHLLVVRNALFALFRAVFGLRAELYFAAVLATHLCNVGLLFVVARRLTGSARLACFGATLWAISPLHEGSLGWYSVYGHVVATTALLVVLLRATGAARPTAAERAGWYALALAASASFGVGVGAALVLPAVIVLLRPDWRGWSQRPPLWTLVASVPLLYVGLHWLYVRISGEPIPGLRELLSLLGRSAETAPPQGVAQILVSYAAALPAVVAMTAETAAYGLAQLVVGFPSLAGWPAGWWAALAVLGGTAAVALGDRRVRRPLIACALLVAACYGIIAAGRAPALRALGVAHAGIAERYHYAATVPLALLLCLVLAAAGRRLRLGTGAAAALLAAWLAWAVLSYLRFGMPIEHHDVARTATARVLEEIGGRARAAAPGTTVYLANRPFAPITAMITARDFPGWGGLFAAFAPADAVDGRAVRFVVQSPSLAAAVRRGRRGSVLFLARTDLPPGAPVIEPDPVDAELREQPFGFGAGAPGGAR